MIEWPPEPHTASMSQSDIVDHQSTGSREGSNLYATIKSTTVEPPTVTLAIDLAKDVIELSSINGVGLNDGFGSPTDKARYTNTTAPALRDCSQSVSR